MPIVKIGNSELLKQAVHFAKQLKCTIESGKMKMNDLMRVDLFTELGIERQILLLSGHSRECDFLEKAKAFLNISTSSENCFEVRFKDASTASKIIKQEYLAAVHHYFGEKVQLLVSENSLFCKSDLPMLASLFCRSIFADACDISPDFNKIKFFVTHEVRDLVLSERESIFLSCNKVIDYFGQTVSEKDIVNSLEKFGYKINSFVDSEGYSISVPFFRGDVYSESDILEDIMLVNLDKFGGNCDVKIRKQSSGGGYCNISTETIIAMKLLNFGFKELSLLSHKGLPLPTSIEKDDVFRSSILPSLLSYEMSKQHKKYPHKIFEIDTVLNGSKQHKRLGVLLSESEANFNELYLIIHSIFSGSFGRDVYLEESYSEYYEKGASFDIMENKSKLGSIGVLSLKFAKKIGLRTSCICSEINL